MQDDAGEESLSELVAEPPKVPSIGWAGSVTGLYLDTDDPAVGELDDDVDLARAVLVPKMVKGRGVDLEGGLGANLGQHEGFQQTADRPGVAQNALDVQPQRRGGEP